MIVNLLTCDVLIPINRRTTSLVVIREAVVPCIEHTVVIEHVVLPYFVRSQVKATLNAPSGGIPNCIPTGWYEFKCRATLLCDNVTPKTNLSLSRKTSLSQSREVKRRALSHRNCLHDKLGIKTSVIEQRTTPRPVTFPRRHREPVSRKLGRQGTNRWSRIALQASG